MGNQQERASGHRRPVDFALVLIANKFRRFLATVAGPRRASRDRFKRPIDSLRIVLLGVILATFGALTFISRYLDLDLIGYFPGMSAIFGGLAVAIFITRIGSPRLYLDWIMCACFYVALGLVVARNPYLVTIGSRVAFATLFVLSAVMRVWTGWAVGTVKCSAWLVAGGLTTLFLAAEVIICYALSISVIPEVIIGVDLIVQSMAIVGFGFSLKKPNE